MCYKPLRHLQTLLLTEEGAIADYPLQGRALVLFILRTSGDQMCSSLFQHKDLR